MQYQREARASDTDWFDIRPNAAGTHWEGTCWAFHDRVRFEFKFEFDVPVGYPRALPEVAIPELDGKTAKIYRGGKICTDLHFLPLWSRNAPRFGIVHLLTLGVRSKDLPLIAEEGRGKAGGRERGTTNRCVVPRPRVSQLAPWLATEVPSLVARGVLKP